jgi:hypothetical protein
MLTLLQSEAHSDRSKCSTTIECYCYCINDSAQKIGELDVEGKTEDSKCCTDLFEGERAEELCRD